jgi:hypothetical protein
MRRVSCAATGREAPEKSIRRTKINTPKKLLVKNMDGLL